MNHLILLATANAPALVTAAGDRAPYRFLEFFTAQICNPHTRRAYVRAVGAFCAWLENHGIPSIAAVGSIHVAAYVEDLGSRHSALTIKQHLAAIRMMFDWLAIAGSSLSKADCHSPAFIRFPP
jgi:site-specific recombinase XerD